ncbi:MAG: hypothetical protein IH872_03225 [Chloroflexi bacterium]|nr:hypothetical protein [Chloroflexota bacterium]
MSTPSQPDETSGETPNEIPYEVKACARCRSTEIDPTEGFHPFGRWRCRSCDRAFMIPALQIRILPAHEMPPRHWHWE